MEAGASAPLRAKSGLEDLRGSRGAAGNEHQNMDVLEMRHPFLENSEGGQCCLVLRKRWLSDPNACVESFSILFGLLGCVSDMSRSWTCRSSWPLEL